jgi:hypothetical protein
VHFLVFQLILADTLVSCITMPMEAIWRLTIQWYADNLTCKVTTEQQISSRIHSSFTGVKVSFKVGLKWGSSGVKGRYDTYPPRVYEFGYKRPRRSYCRQKNKPKYLPFFKGFVARRHSSYFVQYMHSGVVQ